MLTLYDRDTKLYWQNDAGRLGPLRTAKCFHRVEILRIIFNHYRGDKTRVRLGVYRPRPKPKQSIGKTLLAELLEPYRPPKPKYKRRMKLAVLAYVPPHDRFNPKVFVENIRRFKPATELVLFSDNWPDTVKIGQPDDIRKAATAQNPQQKWSLNNILFFTALRIAVRNEYSHIIYVEADSRVGCDGWDGMIFDEFFKHPGAIVGGSMVCYNPANHSLEATERWVKAVSVNSRKNFPIPTYGWKGAADKVDPCVFVNGSLGVYDVGWMKKLFNLDDSAREALVSTAWDMEVGVRLWPHLGVQTYDFIAHLTCMFSSYGEILTTEEQRLEMLRSGKVCAVHQVKSDKTI